jgi:phosphoribosyl-ATP pyrophosphohydrolase
MTIRELYAIICERRDHPSASSYTASLFSAGEDKIIKKVGEEAMEVILAAKGQTRQRMIEEVADLTYHTLVLMAEKGLTPDDIMGELEHRHTAHPK